MKATVDQELCIGCGVCVDIAPDVFRMNDEDKAEADCEVTADLESGAEEAKESCPTEAISVE